MRRLFFTLLITFAYSSLNAQTLDFDRIKNAVLDSTSFFYYPKLLNIFNTAPEELNKTEISYLYYGRNYTTGNSFTKDYINCIESLRKNNKYKTKINCENALEKDPTNIELLSYMLAIDKEKKVLYENQFSTLISTIITSGNGEKGNPFIVNSVGEEYTIGSFYLKENLGTFQRTSKMTNVGYIDYFSRKSKSFYFLVLINFDEIQKN